MKKILSLAVIAAATLFASCNNGSPKASMKNDVDTLSYEIGLSQTAGIENYFQQSGIDSAYIDDFLRGVKDGALAGDDKKKQAYYAGVQAGVQMKTQMFPLATIARRNSLCATIWLASRLVCAIRLHSKSMVLKSVRNRLAKMPISVSKLCVQKPWKNSMAHSAKLRKISS